MRLVCALACAALALTLAVTTASAYIRLEQACASTPACGGARSAGAAGPDRLSTARLVHRACAAAVGALALALAALAWRQPRRAGLRRPCVIVLLLTLFLAALGRQASPASPAVVLANVMGGIALAGVLAWLGTRSCARTSDEASVTPSLAPLCTLAGLTVALGVVPGALVMHAAIGLVAAGALATLAMHGPVAHRRCAIALTALATLQLGVGPALAAGHFPVGLGVAHNLSGALLVAGLGSLFAQRGSA